MRERVCGYTCTLIVDFNKKTRIVSYSILIRYGLVSIDTSFRVLYPCHTGVVPAVLCYNFQKNFLCHRVVLYPCPCFLGYGTVSACVHMQERESGFLLSLVLLNVVSL